MKKLVWSLGVWQLVSELALEMASGSAMDVLRERMTWMEKALGEWLGEEGTMASWAEHTMGEIQVQRSLLETHDNFFKEKLVGLKSEMQSLMGGLRRNLGGKEFAISLLPWLQ